MSIRHSILALLDQGPRYGYQLRSEFEGHTGSSLNVGQVYTTLDRLVRDGLVSEDGEDAAGHRFHRITQAGRSEVREWFATPVGPDARPRDELAVKLALAAATEGVDVLAVIQVQRTDTVRALQDYTRLKARREDGGEAWRGDGGGEGGEDLAWMLVLDSLIFHAEAEMRWLDHCEGRLVAREARVARVARVAPGTRGTEPDNGGEALSPAAAGPDGHHA
ncbi:MAG: PadR family transcriptional regulator [Acidimicrobiales bacterium]